MKLAVDEVSVGVLHLHALELGGACQLEAHLGVDVGVVQRAANDYIVERLRVLTLILSGGGGVALETFFRRLVDQFAMTNVVLLGDGCGLGDEMHTSVSAHFGSA